jgi:hypothetical protein
VLYAVTKLNSVDVSLLCSCLVCGRMSLSSVVCVCAWSSCPGEFWSLSELVFLKCVKVCMNCNKRNNRNNMHGATIKKGEKHICIELIIRKSFWTATDKDKNRIQLTLNIPKC